MITDKVPRSKTKKDEYLRSDNMRCLVLPALEPLRAHALHLEDALAKDSRNDVRAAAKALFTDFSQAFGIPVPPVKVLGARPLEITETSTSELFGDYDFDTHLIRLWMRTSVQQRTTSYGTFLSTLCHELCHHLDVVSFDFPNTFHTRGFYERAGFLYHNIRGTTVRPLFWNELSDGTFQIDWKRTMATGSRR